MIDYTQELIDELHRERVETYQPLTREGNYGRHLTYTGKVTYQRPRHWFTRRDWERIGRKFFIPAVQEGDPEQPYAFWWMEILKKYTLDMMDEILDLPGLKALNLDGPDIYNNLQVWSSEVGLKWADKLERNGNFFAARIVREGFTLRRWR